MKAVTKRRDQQLFDQYVEACNYPGRLDEKAVNDALAAYCLSLGIQRKIVRLGSDFLRQADLVKAVYEIANKINPGAALDARDARDALDALDAKAIKRFAQWCILSRPYWYWELSWIVTTRFGG